MVDTIGHGWSPYSFRIRRELIRLKQLLYGYGSACYGNALN